MEPFPTEYLSDFINRCERVVSIEANYTGQLAWLVEHYCKKEVNGRVIKYNGRTVSEDEVVFAYKQINYGEKKVVLTGGE